MALKLITPPTALAITLAEAKAHLRVTDTTEDLLISAMILAASETAEQITGRAIMPQTWELALDAFPAEFALTRVPALSVVSLKYLNEAGALTTLDPSAYTLNSVNDFGFAYVEPAYSTEWPATRDTTNAVTLRFTAGYADATVVPESIKAWIKLTVSTMYENREAEAYSSRAVSATVKMSFVDGLLDRYKVWA